jgi:hypothetical protein
LLVRGTCCLNLHIGGRKILVPIEIFLVVEDLVVPLLLGTPWIDGHVIQIERRTREVLPKFPGSPTFRVPLKQASTGSMIRVATPRSLPAFSETLVEVRTTRSRLSLLRPSRQRTEYVQDKNGVAELPVSGYTFMCCVAL